ncbi:MAG: hypothetical protein IJ287_01195 [Methanobrevibacter sp.]|nr:hypothetical protein [Methanobrevibacter sp.]
MKKATIKNEHLRKLLNEIEINGEETPDETFKRLMCELKHSCLITAGDMNSNMLNLFTIMT